MSSRIIRLSAPNSASVSARASSVLPTPVGPRNRKLPTGRSGSPSPARDRRAAPALDPARGRAARLARGADRLVLPDDPFVQVLLQTQQPVLLLLGELGHLDAG